MAVDNPQPFAQNAPIPGVGQSYPLSNALFTLEPGKYTNAVDVQGKWVIARLDEKIPATTPPLEEVGMMVRGDLRLSEGQKMGREAAEKLIAQAQDLGSLAKAAEAAGRPLGKSESITRETSQISGMGIQFGIRDAVFALGPGQAVVPEPFTVLGDAIVVGPGETEMPSDEEIEEQSVPVREALLERGQREFLQRYVEELKALANIRVNTLLLEQIPPV